MGTTQFCTKKSAEEEPPHSQTKKARKILVNYDILKVYPLANK